MMSAGVRAAIALAALAALSLLAASCQSELPAPPAGRRISGAIRYAGTFHQTLVRPALQIAVLTHVPDPNNTSRPHGLAVIETRQLAIVPYEIPNLTPFRYRLVARVIDLAQPTFSEHLLPSGGYPDLCTFLDAPEGNVEVTEAAPARDVDVTLYDSGGTTDPCFTAAASPCPKAGAGSLEVLLELDRPPGQLAGADQLIFAMLKTPDEFPPTRFRILKATDIASKGGFPYTLIVNDVPPESYIVYACYDVGGNSITGCGPEDFISEYMKRAKLTIEAGKITTIRLGLDGGTSELVGVTDPATRSCPAQ
jgi:hypothetical protein